MAKQHIEPRLDIEKLKFFVANKHDNPKRGCLESHLKVIREAVIRGDKAILIMEDDALFIGRPEDLPLPPTDWDMLYFGGTVKDVYGDLEDAEGNVNHWVKMRCWTTHCYVLNLENPELVAKVLKMEDYDQEVDRYYLNKIHPYFNCYMANPMICIQRPGFSDIEGREVSYEFMQETLQRFREPEHEEVKDHETGNLSYVMKLPDIADADLPGVTVITPTYNRRKLFALAERNFTTQNYPKERLQWVILDDSDDPDLSIDDLVPDLGTLEDGTPRVVYIKLERGSDPVSVAYKRNVGVKTAKYDYIVHMDDDDYYPPSSVLVRVKLLVKYGESQDSDDGDDAGAHKSTKSHVPIRCVGCSSVGVYDLIHDASSISTDGTLALSEASMAYTRSFWETRNFNDFDRKGEYFNFIRDRFDEIMNVPYSFVIYALTHKTNLTDKLRQIKKTQTRYRGTDDELNFINSCWDEDTEFFIRGLASYLKRASNFSVPIDFDA